MSLLWNGLAGMYFQATSIYNYMFYIQTSDRLTGIIKSISLQFNWDVLFYMYRKKYQFTVLSST